MLYLVIYRSGLGLPHSERGGEAVQQIEAQSAMARGRTDADTIATFCQKLALASSSHRSRWNEKSSRCPTSSRCQQTSEPLHTHPREEPSQVFQILSTARPSGALHPSLVPDAAALWADQHESQHSCLCIDLAHLFTCSNSRCRNNRSWSTRHSSS